MQSQPIEFLEFRQKRSAVFRDLHISKTTILRVLSGEKSIRSANGEEVTAKQGRFLYLRPGETLTIGNIVSDTGLYRSQAIVVDDAVVSKFLVRHPNPHPASAQRYGDMSEAFDDAFTRVVAGIGDASVPTEILLHRCQELLIWVQSAGSALTLQNGILTTDRVRDMLGKDLGRSWRAPEAARKMGMSEATLRRALATEGTTFSELLRELRVSNALTLVLTTNQPLADIAYQCGFSSQARLSEAFRTRFDHTPREIRAEPTVLERIA